MKLISIFKEIVLKLDLFNSGSLLRVKGEPEHQTILGGIVSIALMVALIAAFSNRIIDTLDKVIITSTNTLSNANDPIPISISTIDAGPFMIGVQILNLNLNEGKRYFDITLTNSVSSYGAQQSGTVEYNLEPCTKAHWNGYDSIQSNFDNLNIDSWLCLPKNLTFELRGKFVSALSKTLDITASTCTNGSNPRPCASQAEIDQYFTDSGLQFFSVYFINPLINSDTEEYLQYYLEDVNYIAFSQKGGEQSRIFVEDYTIQTDQSILPYSDTLVETGAIITSSGIKSTLSDISDTYGTFYFYKSATSTVYNRSFQKLDDVFSYIGGLFGIILIAFFMIGIYNTYKFEINLAGYLYKSEDNDKTEKSYNFFHFLAHSFYKILIQLNVRPKWQKLAHYDQTREEMLKQLDVLLLFKRINFLERSLTYLFSDHQLKGLYLSNQLTMDDAVGFRKNYKLKIKLKSEIQTLKRARLNQGQTFKGQNENNNSIINYKLCKSEQILNNTSENPKLAQNDPADCNGSVMNSSFDSDQYSSDESSEEQQRPTNIMGSVKRLQEEQESNETSRKIWRSLDGRLYNYMQLQGREGQWKINNEECQDHNEYPADSSNMQIYNLDSHGYVNDEINPNKILIKASRLSDSKEK